MEVEFLKFFKMFFKYVEKLIVVWFDHAASAPDTEDSYGGWLIEFAHRSEEPKCAHWALLSLLITFDLNWSALIGALEGNAESAFLSADGILCQQWHSLGSFNLQRLRA